MAQNVEVGLMLRSEKNRYISAISDVSGSIAGRGLANISD